MRPAPREADADSEPDESGPTTIEERLNKLAVREGDVVLEKYRLLGLLAASNTGAVFLATHIELGHEVAVKLLLEPFAYEAGVRARFMREAKLMSRIESDHVARVIDVGELANGTPVIAMESLRGEDLRRTLRKHKNGIDPLRAVDLIIQACLGLAAAHARGIVHRDIKPSNLFVAQREDGTEVLKIIDFGVAKMRAGTASLSDALTNPSSLVGSPRYMAPEQITSARDVDARSDVWALACILHELLTGAPVFGVRGVSNVLRMIVSGVTPTLSERAPSLSPALSAVIERALVKDRNARTPNVAMLARDLYPHASESGRALVARVAKILGVESPPVAQSTPPFGPFDAGVDPAVHDTIETSPVSDKRQPSVTVLGPAAPVRIGPLAIGRSGRVPIPVLAAAAGGLLLLMIGALTAIWLALRIPVRDANATPADAPHSERSH
jgi:serine/threonine-protein kinase